MQFTHASDAYLAYIKYQRCLSKTTVQGYTSYLHYFQTWLTENGYPDPSIDCFTTPVVPRFVQWMCASGLRPRTVLSACNPIRGLGLYLVEHGVITENPLDRVTMPKKDAAVRRVVTDDEVAKLFEACDRQRSDKDIALSRAVLSVLAYGGLRRQELLDLCVADLNLEEGSILVRRGKGNKSRKLFVCRECRDALLEWMHFRGMECQHDYVWAHDRSRRISEERLRDILETLKAIAGLKHHKDIVPHSLRHNCATRLMSNGANLGAISSFLGHTSLNTTQIYLHVNEEQLRGIAELGSLGERRTTPTDGHQRQRSRDGQPEARQLPARQRERTASFIHQRRTR
jgi:site-specific recombinase XerD